MENKYRKDFPLFKAIDENQAGENKGLVYLDTAATAQRPFIVLNAMTHFYATENANPLRGLYSLSERATLAYENARQTVAQFINAKQPEEIVFTRNASESLNLVAYSWGLNNLHESDEICVTIMEHHSNIVPWQMVCKKTGAKLVGTHCKKVCVYILNIYLHVRGRLSSVYDKDCTNAVGCLPDFLYRVSYA